MLRRAISSSRNCGGTLYQQCRKLSERYTDATKSSAVNTMVLRSLKDHYLKASNMSPPPKIAPPSEFLIVKGALDSNGPVLQRHYNNEEINITVMRLANIVEEDVDDDNVADDDDDQINQLYVHIDVSKPAKDKSLTFLCGLYPDVLSIHSVSLRPKSKSREAIVLSPNMYTEPLFETLDEKTRDAFYNYIQERGINETLFPFLQAWIYVKDNRKLMHWFRSVGLFVSGQEAMKEIDQAKGAANANVPRVARGT